VIATIGQISGILCGRRQSTTDFACLESSGFDLGYITELDPLWGDDETGFILNPEAALFGNPIAQAACVADCGLASAGFSNDAFFWCNGCQGSLYPFTGTVLASTYIVFEVQ
jgi:conjugal transfer pilus assembly protein TraU